MADRRGRNTLQFDYRQDVLCTVFRHGSVPEEAESEEDGFEGGEAYSLTGPRLMLATYATRSWP